MHSSLGHAHPESRKTVNCQKVRIYFQCLRLFTLLSMKLKKARKDWVQWIQNLQRTLSSWCHQFSEECVSYVHQWPQCSDVTKPNRQERGNVQSRPQFMHLGYLRLYFTGTLWRTFISKTIFCEKSTLQNLCVFILFDTFFLDHLNRAWNIRESSTA